MNRYEKIKNMTIEEMTEFLQGLLYNEENNEVKCCNDCMHYGTHHTDKSYVGTEYEYLYECKDCEFENDNSIKVWLESSVSNE